MSSVKKITIRKKLFKNIVVLSLSTLVIAALVLSTILYYSDMSNINKIIKEKNIAIKYFTEGYFTKIRNNVELLSKIKKVVNAPSLSTKDRNAVLNLYESLEKVDSDINYIYSGYKDGSLLINNYIPPKNYNPIIRPWYKAALKAKPNISKGVPYKEAKTKQWLISISKVLINDKNQTNGVIAIDSSVTKIEKMLQEKSSKYKSSYSMISTIDGEIIIAQNKALLHKNIFDILGHHINFAKQSGNFDCNLKDVKKLIYYTRINKLGWVILTVIDKSEIIKPIITQIVVIVLAIGFIIFIFGWILSSSLSKQFIMPLVKLKTRVHMIVSNDSKDDISSTFAKDEISIIALDIEKLARSELYKKNKELKNANEKLKLLSTTDPLTALYNRRKMNAEIKQEYNRSLRYKTKFSLIMFDIDWFKKINDNYGHQIGDYVLKELSKLTKDTVRSTDIVSRWGGEEFLILCTQTDLDTAYNLAIRLREETQSFKFSVGIKLTISIGVHEFDGNESIDELLKKVDDKLYEAKQNGRNRVVS